MALRNIIHPLQTKAWGEFREKTGVKVVHGKDWQVTIHPLPHTPWTIGYFPKGPMPDKKMVEELKQIGHGNNCIFIQLEPNIEAGTRQWALGNSLGLRPSVKPLFTKYNFILDLTKSEEELLKNMHPKTRYNIRIAEKHGVEVREETNDKGFKTYLKLYFETTRRQHYFGHTEKYHRLMWETLKEKGIARILIAYYKKVPLTAWMLFKVGDVLYYPYGGSSVEYRNVMSNNLVAWEVIKLGKKLGCKSFDMWGALGPDADSKDPWYGFHKFKQGYGGRLVEYVGSYDLVLNPTLYWAFHLIDKLRWLLLRIRS